MNAIVVTSMDNNLKVEIHLDDSDPNAAQFVSKLFAFLADVAKTTLEAEVK